MSGFSQIQAPRNMEVAKNFAAMIDAQHSVMHHLET
jgi:hypothetical protein